MTGTNSSQDIKDLLLRLGYPEARHEDILAGLEELFENTGFYELEQKARAALDAKDVSGLVNTLKDMMKRMEDLGIYRPDHPAPLLKMLVNGLNLRNEDIFEVLERSGLSCGEIRKEQEFLASCAAITQLGYILICRAAGEGRAAGSGEHVFILVEGLKPDSMIFVDFSIDSILEINAGDYEKDENNYRLKAQAAGDETSKHVAQYYSRFRTVSGIGLSHNIHNNIGMAYDKAGRHEEALCEYKEALRLDPGYVEVYNNIAVAYHGMGMIDEAIKSLKTAIGSRPGYVEARCNLGNIYSSAGRYEEALAELEAALSIDPGNAAATNGMGSLYAEQDRVPEAIAAFRASLERDPDYLPARKNLGSLYAAKGRYEEALREFQEVVKRDTGQPEAYCGMGEAYYELGSFDRSAEAWMRAVILAPEFIDRVPEKLLLKVKRGISRMG